MKYICANSVFFPEVNINFTVEPLISDITINIHVHFINYIFTLLYSDAV